MYNKKIADERDITIHNINYKQIIYEDGKTILKTFNEKYKVWVISKFSRLDDTKIVDNIVNTATSVLN